MNNYLSNQRNEINDLFREMKHVIKKRSLLLIIIALFMIILNSLSQIIFSGRCSNLVNILNSFFINFITVITILESYLRANYKNLHSQDISNIANILHHFITRIIDKNPYSPQGFMLRGSAYNDGYVIYGEEPFISPFVSLKQEVITLKMVLKEHIDENISKEKIEDYLDKTDISNLENILQKIDKLPIELNKLNIYQAIKSIINNYQIIYYHLEKSEGYRNAMEESFWENYIDILDDFLVIIDEFVSSNTLF